MTSTLQVGSISLTLSDTNDATKVFSESGSLVGNITGTEDFGTTLLSHRAKFPQGNMFFTKADKAVLEYPFVRKTLDDGTPCSFWIQETISNLSRGTKFFRNVTSVDIKAAGYISNCPDENENHFELSGEVCVE